MSRNIPEGDENFRGLLEFALPCQKNIVEGLRNLEKLPE